MGLGSEVSSEVRVEGPESPIMGSNDSSKLSFIIHTTGKKGQNCSEESVLDNRYQIV